MNIQPIDALACSWGIQDSIIAYSKWLLGNDYPGYTPIVMLCRDMEDGVQIVDCLKDDHTGMHPTIMKEIFRANRHLGADFHTHQPINSKIIFYML